MKLRERLTTRSRRRVEAARRNYAEQNPTFLALVAETAVEDYARVDAWIAREVWERANPALGHTVDLDSLRRFIGDGDTKG
jgi:phage terminase large subunit-like protein